MMQPPPPEFAPYPRQSYGPDPLGPAPKRVRFDGVADAWRLLLSDVGTWLATSLILVVVVLAIEAPLVISAVQNAMEHPASDQSEWAQKNIGLTLLLTF